MKICLNQISVCDTAEIQSNLMAILQLSGFNMLSLSFIPSVTKRQNTYFNCCMKNSSALLGTAYWIFAIIQTRPFNHTGQFQSSCNAVFT